MFALGSVLFECLTGVPAFPGDSAVSVLARVLFEEAPRVSHLRSEVPAALDRLVAGMLDKDPALRPRDGAAVVTASSERARGGRRRTGRWGSDVVDGARAAHGLGADRGRDVGGDRGMAISWVS